MFGDIVLVRSAALWTTRQGVAIFGSTNGQGGWKAPVTVKVIPETFEIDDTSYSLEVTSSWPVSLHPPIE